MIPSTMNHGERPLGTLVCASGVAAGELPAAGQFGCTQLFHGATFGDGVLFAGVYVRVPGVIVRALFCLAMTLDMKLPVLSGASVVTVVHAIAVSRVG